MELQTDPLLDAVARTSDGVFAVDEEYRITLWSEEAQRIMGYNPEEVLGRTCYELMRGRDSSGNPYCHRDCEPMLCTLRAGKTPTYDLQTQGRDGRALWLNITVIGLPGQSGGSTQSVHLIRNVTRQRRAQELAERVMEAVAELNVAAQDVGATPRDRHPALTARELEVLQLLAAGLRTEGVGERLNISPVTARNHIQRILGKLGVRRRSEAIAYAFRHGLV